VDKKVIYLLRVISFFERSLYCEMSRSTVLGGGELGIVSYDTQAHTLM